MASSNLDVQETGARGGKRRSESRKRLLAAARELFVTRGYHATRPQDIAKAAGLGHGTFYLHFADKRACFLAFVDEARAEVDEAVLARTSTAKDLPTLIEAALSAIYEYSESHPGVLATATTDESVIASGEDATGPTLLQRWGDEWADFMKAQAAQGLIASDFDWPILGQAIIGAIHQASTTSSARGATRAQLLKTLTQLLVRALTPKK